MFCNDKSIKKNLKFIIRNYYKFSFSKSGLNPVKSLVRFAPNDKSGLKHASGNVRVAFTDENGTPQVMQKNNYYPCLHSHLSKSGTQAFGLLMTERTNTATNKNPYLYNGKLKQSGNPAPAAGEMFTGEFYNWYDYGARMYDPQLGRWHSPDPLGELIPDINTYHYCYNNPVVLTDPTGMWVEYESSYIISKFKSPYDASTFIDPNGTVIDHWEDGDPRVYLVKDVDSWRKNGSKKEDAEHVGYEYPGMDYASMIGKPALFYPSTELFMPAWLNDGAIETDYTLESFFIPIYGWLKCVKFGGKITYKLTAKITKQLAKRGWTDDLISKTLNKPYTTRMATNKATGNRATAFFAKDGSYIVIDDVTHEIIQVSDRIKPWFPDHTIVNTYIPKK